MILRTDRSLLPAGLLSPCLLLLLAGTAPGQATRQVADINKVRLPKSSNPAANRGQRNHYKEDNSFALLGPRAVFAASSATTGQELYTSLGTATGGGLVMDIYPGRIGSSPNYFTEVGNKVYFVANDGKHGTELWVTDGKKAGTRMVVDLFPGLLSSDPKFLCPLGNSGKLVFQATSPTTITELFISDGTRRGTKLLKSIAGGSGLPAYMKSFHNGKKDIVVFSARTTNQGTELWATDGTAQGTILVKDIVAGAGSSTPRYFQVLGKTVLFQTTDPLRNTDLWLTDGTPAGTRRLKTVAKSSQYGAGLYFGVSLKGRYYFEGGDSKTGVECWVTDGTAAGTALVSDSVPGARSGYFKHGVAMGVRIIYTGFSPGQGYEPWVLNTITKKAVLLKDIRSGTSSSSPILFTAIGNQAVFHAWNDNTGAELYITNGTTAGTRILKNIYPGSFSSQPAYLTSLAPNRVLFRAISYENQSYNNDLWVTDGTAKGTIKVPVHWRDAPTASSNPSDGAPLLGKLYFAADDGVTGTELWTSDGTTPGTVMVRDIFPGTNKTGVRNSSSPKYLVRAGNRLVFAADDGKGKGRELWASDGSAAGTQLLHDLFDGPGSSDPRHLSRVGNKIFFTAHGYDDARPRNYVGRELYVTDGTAAGTRFVANIQPGALSSSAKGFTEIGNTGRFVFSAYGVTTRAPFSSVGFELYVSDGTTAGTRLLKDIYPGTASSFPSGFQAMGGRVYFSAYTQSQGTELWVTDGTPVGTKMIKDIWSGRSSSFPRYLHALGGKLYFQARGSTALSDSGAELWESNGTAQGTKLFKDLAPGAYSARPSFITAVGSRHLWFAATTGVGSSGLGAELWTSDLTNQGTRIYRDIWPGYIGSSPGGFNGSNNRFVVVAGKVFFAATTPAGGRELWLVDNGATSSSFGDACKSSHMSSTDPVLGGTARISGTTSSGFSANLVLLGIRSPKALAMGGECRLHLSPFGPILIVGSSTGTRYAATLPIPNIPRLIGSQMALQTVHLGSPFPGGSGFSNGLEWSIGK